MEQSKPKKLPYGGSNFEKIRTEGYAYVDKTRFIELLEQEDNDKLFFTRSRKFGKSLFFSMLFHYYDVCSADKFPQLFGDLYIGQHPTPKKNELLVIKFNFSGIDTATQEGFAASFSENIQNDVLLFLEQHRDVLADSTDTLMDDVRSADSIKGYLKKVFVTARAVKMKLLVIIDEYDHFANDFIAMGTPEGIDLYKQNIRANGMVRDFYETLKEGSETVIDRIILAGITPIMLDDLTSGFNVASNISLKAKYNEILGFTQSELEWLMRETGVDASRIDIDMKQLYDGYKFHYEGEHTVYNPSMMLYILKELLDTSYKPESLIDENIQMDYGRIRMLLSDRQNRQQLWDIISNSCYYADVVKKFSLDRLHDSKNFISLLFYLGLLTIDDSGPSRLKVPNSSIKSIYWDCIEEMTFEADHIRINPSVQAEALYNMAYHGKPLPFIDFMVTQILRNISNRDLIRFDEKYIKVMILSRVMGSALYNIISEPEFSGGYADIWFERSPVWPDIPYEWIWELKYVPKSGDEAAIARSFADARIQLERYRASERLKERRDMRYLAVVFIGKDEYRTEELG